MRGGIQKFFELGFKFFYLDGTFLDFFQQTLKKLKNFYSRGVLYLNTGLILNTNQKCNLIPSLNLIPSIQTFPSQKTLSLPMQPQNHKIYYHIKHLRSRMKSQRPLKMCHSGMLLIVRSEHEHCSIIILFIVL